MRTKKKLFVIIAGVIVILAVVSVLLFWSPAQINDVQSEQTDSARSGETDDVQSEETDAVQTEQTDSLPIIVYRKMVVDEPMNHIYGLYVHKLGSTSQEIDRRVSYFKVSPDGQAIGFVVDSDDSSFVIDNDDSYKRDLYLMDATGDIQLISNEALLDDFSFACGSEILCYHHYSEDIVYIMQYGNVEEVHDVGAYKWQISADGSTVIFLNDDSTDDLVDDWSEINLSVYRDGEVEEVAKSVYISDTDRYISDDGETFIYMKIDDPEEFTRGGLYIKRGESEPELIYEKTTRDMSISGDGDFVAAIVFDEDGNDALLYQFGEEEPQIIKGVSYYIMSGDGTTLAYTVSATGDWDYELYTVKKGNAPQLLAEHVAFVGAVSEDGDSVACIKNYHIDNDYVGDLYWYRDGKSEFIDSEVRASSYGEGVYMYKDGSILGYLKNFYEVGDLYIKQGDEEPQKVDEKVYYYFDYFK